MAEKPVYTKPTSQVWAEEQEESGYASNKVLSTFSDEPPESDGKERKLQVEGNDTEAYVGVDPVYQTYANDTEAPLKATRGVEQKLEERVYGDGGSKEATEDVASEKKPATGVKAPDNK